MGQKPLSDAKVKSMNSLILKTITNTLYSSCFLFKTAWLRIINNIQLQLDNKLQLFFLLVFNNIIYSLFIVYSSLYTIVQNLHTSWLSFPMLLTLWCPLHSQCAKSSQNLPKMQHCPESSCKRFLRQRANCWKTVPRIFKWQEGSTLRWYKCTHPF